MPGPDRSREGRVMTATADPLDTLRVSVAAILRDLARAEAARLEKLAGMAERAHTPREVRAILATAARGAQAVTAARPDWREKAVFRLGFAQEDMLPDNWGCCTAGEPCPSHAERFAVSAFLGMIRDAAEQADGPEDAGWRIAEVIARGDR